MPSKAGVWAGLKVAVANRKNDASSPRENGTGRILKQAFISGDVKTCTITGN
jgi:hypothetical protein